MADIMDRAFRQVADRYFDWLFHSYDSNPEQQSMFDCALSQGKTTISMYNAPCASYCISIFLDPDNQRDTLLEYWYDPCEASNSTCCKIKREYCMIYDDAGNPTGVHIQETREDLPSECVPEMPPQQRCRTENVISNERLPCAFICGGIEEQNGERNNEY